ncbi:hypothetical protein BKA67DRAFT_84549 [Truncatella angustata]|uniref:Uncharacterized protein n=1 Tax=Truncatella angustata TaxID=152316 RepID=A0A9P8UZT9_9PEZI|nr:uncharacterized protein BKA67DRAFT_84549 [Truncatella angustata]KAH6661407.1 hypothetical protein BKA67DRAFT_84549 [Truncatella angustata]KAH8194870.1 hypothetical protein TruAng_010967 [Truncatella angustata]
MDASPAKRRVLGPLDANLQSPVSHNTSKQGQVKPQAFRDTSPTTTINGGIKRSMCTADHQPAKRQCKTVSCPAPVSSNDNILPSEERDCSASPEPSSVFDNSAIDTSQATCTTEPDPDLHVHADTGANADALALALVHSPPRLPRPLTITRDEARQKAEVLRLRLGLAGYKLRTGQENVPLERLQLRRISSRKSDPHLACTAQTSNKPASRQAILQTSDHSSDLPIPRAARLRASSSPEKNRLPTLPPASSMTPPPPPYHEEGCLPSNATKGGAAKGLLSLSRS